MKTLTITREEYKRAVAEAIIDMTEEDNSTNDAKSVLLEIAVSTRFGKALEDKLFGEDKDE